MILAILLENGQTIQVDVGDVTNLTKDEKTQALNTALTQAGVDTNSGYIILGEA